MPAEDEPNANHSSLTLQIVLLTLMRTVMTTSLRLFHPFRMELARGLRVDVSYITAIIAMRSGLSASAFFLGSISDQRGRRFGLVLGMLLFILGLLVASFLPTYIGFCLSQFFVIIAKLVFDPSVQAYVGDRVEYERRGKFLAFLEFSWSGSYFLGIPFVAWVMARFGWQLTFPALIILTIPVAFALWRNLPADYAQQSERSSFREGWRKIARSRSAIGGLVVITLTHGAHEQISIIFGEWLETDFGVTLMRLGLLTAIIGASELSGETLVAGLSDRFGKRRTVITGFSCVVLVTFAFPLAGSLEVAMAVLFLFYLFTEIAIVAMIPLMTEQVPEARATMMACGVAAFSLSRMIGAFSGAWFFSFGIFAVSAATAILLLAALLVFFILVREVDGRNVAPVR